LQFQLLKSFSAGIILGVALLHLLPEGTGILSEKLEYPLAFAFVCIGCMFTLGVDQVTMRNLKLVKIDLENNILLVHGPVPGPAGGYVVVRETNKVG
jgi:formate/nitrite transporter FocA (FNT family)